jgi:hypothetical protein
MVLRLVLVGSDDLVELMGLVLGSAALTVSVTLSVTCHYHFINHMVLHLVLVGCDDLVELMGLVLGNAALTVGVSMLLCYIPVL